MPSIVGSYLLAGCKQCHNFLNIEAYFKFNVSFIMDSSTATTNGVFLPNFPLAEGDLRRAIEHSGSVRATSTDDAGEYFAMAMACNCTQYHNFGARTVIAPLTRGCP